MKASLATHSAVAAVMLAAGYGAALTVPASVPGPAGPEVVARFSPHGGCTAEVVKVIDGAKATVRLAGYQLTSVPVQEALLRAKARGVDVKVIVDRSQAEIAVALAKKELSITVDHHHAIFHHKYLIIDGETVVTGSFNYSAQAEERNAENLLTVTRARELAAAYLTDWEHHASHAVPPGGSPGTSP